MRCFHRLFLFGDRCILPPHKGTHLYRSQQESTPVNTVATCALVDCVDYDKPVNIPHNHHPPGPLRDRLTTQELEWLTYLVTDDEYHPLTYVHDYDTVCGHFRKALE